MAACCMLPAIALGQYVQAGFNVGATSVPTPAVVQGPIVTATDVQVNTNLGGGAVTDNYMVKCFPYATQSGNTIIVMVVTASATSNISLTDDGSSSNTYSLPSGASETAGSQTIAFYVAPVTHASHCVSLTFATPTGATHNQMTMWEYDNLGAVDKACAATVTSGTSLACASMTPTVNGDLLLIAANAVTYGTKPTGFTSYTAQTGTTPTWTLATNDGLGWSAAQTGIQATAGAVTGAITAASAVTRANIAGLAIKAVTAGAAHPSGPYLLSMEVQNSGYPSTNGWGYSTASTATTQTVNFPCQGNAPILLVGNIDSTTVTGVTDNNSNTWAGLTRVDSSGDGFSIQYYNTTNYPATCNGTEKVTVTYGANPSDLDPLWVFFDVAGAASGYDSTATCSSGSTPCATNTSCASSSTATGAHITPSGFPALVLSYFNQDFDTISGINVGQFLTAEEICPNGTNTGCGAAGTGTFYNYQGSGLEQDAGIMADRLASGSAALTWSAQNTQSQNIGACFSSTLAVK